MMHPPWLVNADNTTLIQGPNKIISQLQIANDVMELKIVERGWVIATAWSSTYIGGFLIYINNYYFNDYFKYPPPFP